MSHTRYFNQTSGIENQNQNGVSNFCTSYSTASHLEALFAKVYGQIVPMSNLWGIMLSKQTDGVKDKTGTSTENLFKEIVKHGCCTESVYPTIDKDVNDNCFPATSQIMYDCAKRYRPMAYKKIMTVPEIIEAIDNYGGCVWNVRVYYEHTHAYKGFVSPPKKGSEPHGEHAIFCSGYDLELEQMINGRLEKGFFILDESYMIYRGYKGRLFVPMRYVTEKVTGLYTNDTYFKCAYHFTVKEMPYEHFHDMYTVDIPRTHINLAVKSDIAYVNGAEEKLAIKVPVVAGRSLLPIRFLCENMGYSVKYYPDSKLIEAVNPRFNHLIKMWLGKKEIVSLRVGKEEVIHMDATPQLIKGNTCIPVRAFAECTGAKVEYSNGKITIIGMV